uniref:uncharacterized protein LOC122608736 n=1 Tax=Erigeron canadensis TaxID=72917 RepID=UPI001CB9A980|nr:uncharacterized protein LOC122608736 [Erigeron canadensis]
MRDNFLRELVMLKKKIDGLESEMSMVYSNLSDSLLEVEKEKDDKRCLEQEVQRLRSKLGVSEARVGELKKELEGERTRGKELETHAERSTQLRRDTLLAFPRLFRLVMDHPDVMGVLCGFYRAAVAVGRHSATLDLVGVHPSIDPTSLPFYDESIPDKARKAKAAFVEKSFPILDAIVKDPGASLKDI